VSPFDYAVPSGWTADLSLSLRDESGPADDGARDRIARRQPLALLDNVMPATPSGKIGIGVGGACNPLGRHGSSTRLPSPSEQIPAVVDLTLLDQPHSSTLLGRAVASPERPAAHDAPG